jgi:hypothetical protein
MPESVGDRAVPSERACVPSGRYVFASYAHADSAVVLPELARLTRLGVRVWFDEGIEVGGQ